ncbi:scavenger receptor cysteine-rich type 1 protein M130-like [Scomber japonicus]|uniref:scavenger receptor cysteine-rich type 1 protein M130-like n=1 Tax=Scomber japonicus TaxID=13676 RepID=UPI002305071D|nr:scavenger receptor cysteine-rich type 1 protein M130-like [Scomber japonicus]
MEQAHCLPLKEFINQTFRDSECRFNTRRIISSNHLDQLRNGPGSGDEAMKSGSEVRDCVSPDSSYFIVKITCSEHGEWRPVRYSDWTLKEAAIICRYLDCGSAVSTRSRNETSGRSVWKIKPYCVESGSALMDCVSSHSSSYIVELTCSDSVRLVNGTSLCSGRLEVKSEQSWSSVCEADFDQQDADVVCRELGCGAPSVLQGALYGEVEAPMWTKEFQCGGNESALLDCRRSDSARRTCSPGKAVGLTCSEPVRLVGGFRRCLGTLEVKQGEWRPVSYSVWSLKEADVICRYLDCGSAVSTRTRYKDSRISVWEIRSDCLHSGSALRECVSPDSSSYIQEITCSDSVRLVNGTSLCSGRLEVKSEQSWSSVCEADFDQQDAEVVCRELSCGAPSVLQGALYGEVEAPMWAKEFQCGGHESALLDCRRSDSARRTCSPGEAVGLTCSEPVRLVGGASRCAGTLEVKHGEWRQVRSNSDWTLKEADVMCRYLDCGSALSTRSREEYSYRSVWEIRSHCLHSGSELKECVSSDSSSYILEVTCSDSVRLVNGTRLCSGRLEVKSEQSWSSVCEADFDQQDAEVVCRELGCGAPSVLQGALYGEVEAPMWTKEFQCGGNESALLDCRKSDSARRTCSPGKAVGLTCSEPFRLVGGASRCAGTMEVNQGEWRQVNPYHWTLKEADVICRYLDCGSAVSTRSRNEVSDRSVWRISSDRLHSGSALRDCLLSYSSSSIVELTCSDSVRLVNGTRLCSGRLEVKSEQSWSSVCEADFDQQDAEVVCRELDCGAPSVLQGALYGEVEAPMWTKEFQCGGNESALLDCRRSDSARRTCSPGKAVGLTCSDPVRLVGGASRCAGTLELKYGEWRPVSGKFSDWTLKEAAIICRYLDCGSAVSTESRHEALNRRVWWIRSNCLQSGSALMDCVSSQVFHTIVKVICSDSVRLVNGTRLCSGRLEVKSEQSWSSVCEADFDQQDAEVVCRELGCGAPSVLQGALYGEVEAPMWTKEFQCGGNESALLDCRRSDSARRTCSPGKAVGLTCSETVRLVGGASRCAGTMEVKQGEWRSVSQSGWTLKDADVICRYLDCGSAVSTRSRNETSYRSVWRIRSDCLHSGSALRECVSSDSSSYIVELTCSDSVRLVNGTSLCSGRLEVKSEQSWSSVCEADFDHQDAEVVCRELGCEAPSVLQGALYGEVEAPMWTKEFQCGGRESALLDCRRSDSARRTCSPGKAVGLTCSEPVRLVGGASRCAGTLKVKLGEWRPVSFSFWTLKDADVICRYLDCGSAVSTRSRYEASDRSVWWARPDCLAFGCVLWDCVTSDSSPYIVELTCSDSVRLVNGTSLCSGRLEVKSEQSWSSVCEADFDQQDAEVVCRELGCGAPSVLQGALYGEVEAPMWTKEFQCGGHESALLDCRRSDSARRTCSPGKAVGLTCSDLILVGGASRCAGTLELKHREWRPVSDSDWTLSYSDWTLKDADVICRYLDCGSAVSTTSRKEYSYRSVWRIRSHCLHSGSDLKECVSAGYSSYILEITCSASVRLVNGTSLCSGRLEVKSEQSWSSVCEADFDQQDAEVVCRELGCGAPSVLQGALYGEVEAPMWTKEFQCGGNESALLDCRRSDSARRTCSPGKAVGLTCSEPVRLVGGASRCAGTLEMKQGEWRPVDDSYLTRSNSEWTLEEAPVTCRYLDCGSAVSTRIRNKDSDRSAWSISSGCLHSGSSLRDCVTSSHPSSYVVELTCSGERSTGRGQVTNHNGEGSIGQFSSVQPEDEHRFSEMLTGDASAGMMEVEVGETAAESEAEVPSSLEQVVLIQTPDE